MHDQPNPERLKALEARLAEAKGKDDAPALEEHYSQAQMGWRMVTEFVAGLLLGFGIGYGLDTLLGTGPWMMLVFTLFGLAAGVKTMMATAQELQKSVSKDKGA